MRVSATFALRLVLPAIAFLAFASPAIAESGRGWMHGFVFADSDTNGLAGAATLQAKVLEVQTGNTLIVSNINRSVRVRLKSVVPPEAGQPFYEVARDHLKALVLDQTVMVDYTHLANGYLEAKVFLNGIDIGSQMLRDGAAWYDRATDYELNDADRDLYAQCEKAARAEKRGIWQQESPVAPWEFRRLQQAKLNDIIDGKSSTQPRSSLRTKRTSLSNGDLMGALIGGPQSSGTVPGLRPIVENGRFDRWTSFQSPVSHFSIMIPSNGVETSAVLSDPNGLPVMVNLLAAGSERGFLVLVSGRGPNLNGTDSSILDKSIRTLIDGWNQGASRRGSAGVLTLKSTRDLKLGDYVGRQYSLTSDLFSGTGRVFTKQIREDRQIFVLIALTRPGSEDTGSQFLNSFKITQ
jgi:endonuclease YncB( thermonuclease family)